METSTRRKTRNPKKLLPPLKRSNRLIHSLVYLKPYE